MWGRVRGGGEWPRGDVTCGDEDLVEVGVGDHAAINVRDRLLQRALEDELRLRARVKRPHFDSAVVSPHEYVLDSVLGDVVRREALHAARLAAAPLENRVDDPTAAHLLSVEQQLSHHPVLCPVQQLAIAPVVDGEGRLLVHIERAKAAGRVAAGLRIGVALDSEDGSGHRRLVVQVVPADHPHHPILAREHRLWLVGLSRHVLAHEVIDAIVTYKEVGVLAVDKLVVHELAARVNVLLAHPHRTDRLRQVRVEPQELLALFGISAHRAARGHEDLIALVGLGAAELDAADLLLQRRRLEHLLHRVALHPKAQERTRLVAHDHELLPLLSLGQEARGLARGGLHLRQIDPLERQLHRSSLARARGGCQRVMCLPHGP